MVRVLIHVHVYVLMKNSEFSPCRSLEKRTCRFVEITERSQIVFTDQNLWVLQGRKTVGVFDRNHTFLKTGKSQ